ncbi:MAG: nicotinate phosphoribosyltransferase [Candidatus Marinimicrobia bacterium]|nr:nicotinate phosphoribosyltransferase [Candidatus Neomarinimicrobiota bacterium]MCF7840948.1 nicotinate phosphoribosyltransferase [Candidatus Neomarinimicrobiota bacterium]
MNKSRNLTLLTDLYQVNMAYAYFQSGTAEKQVVFDVFFRDNPCGNGYTVAAGLEQVAEYIRNFHFDIEDLDYLQSSQGYSAEFIDYLKNLSFSGNIDAVPEGTWVFPHEPILRVKAALLEAQLLETTILTLLNHQSLIATKTARIVEAAGTDPVLEFGLRRAQGPDAGVYGARAAYIGGAAATSNLMAGKCFQIPVRGTHAHSFVQSFDDELSAFRAFAGTFPHSSILLVDTYDTLKQGIPNAIKVFSEMRKSLGAEFRNFGIRLDSGDLAYLSKSARKMLDDAGFPEAKIAASSDLDEYLVQDLKLQGARIDIWGVGTNLITSKSCPALAGVYKLAARERNGVLEPEIKRSDNPDKINNPGLKKIVRFRKETTREPILDLIMLDEEPVPADSFLAFDPVHPWKKKRIENFEIESLLKPIFRGGKLAYALPELEDIRQHAASEKATFSKEVQRLTNPHLYHVDLSEKLFHLKQSLLEAVRNHSK